MQSNNPKLVNATPQERLKYLIEKYFRTQRNFSVESGIDEKAISKFIIGKTKRNTTQILKIIEKKIGFSFEYIESGTGDELVKGCNRKPLPTMATKTSVSYLTRIGQKKKNDMDANSGIINKAIMTRWGKTMLLTDYSSANIINIAVNGLDSPIIIETSDRIFCEKYRNIIRLGTNLIIDESRAEDGDYVLVYCMKQYFICEYTDNKLIDIKEDENTEIYIKDRELDINKSKIIGAIYSEVRKYIPELEK